MASAANDVKQMQDQIRRYGSVTRPSGRVQVIEGPAGQSGNQGFINEDTGGVAENKFRVITFNATWQVGNWGDTLTFTPR